MSRPRIMIVSALLLAVLAAATGYIYLRQVAESMSNVEKGYVVVAKKQVPVKTQLTYDLVELEKMPVAYIHPRAARKLDDVIGKVTREPVVAGEEVLLDRIVEEGDSQAGFPYLIPPGKRAVSVAVDEVTAVGWHIRPGDRVDVLATVDLPEGQENITMTTVALQNIEVLAMGKNAQVVRDEGKETKVEVKTVTLAVTLEEARPLILADETGTIRMALRSVRDQERTVTEPYRPKDFLAPVK